MSESTTASEAIAAALRDYAPPLPGHEGHCAQVVVNAVRLMSPEQLAELIGGEFEERRADDGWAGQVTDFKSGATTSHYKPSSVSRRVVGPWLPVIPVTHQGEETT